MSRDVTRCREMSRDVADMSRACRGHVAGVSRACRGRVAAGRERVVVCRRVSTRGHFVKYWSRWGVLEPYHWTSRSWCASHEGFEVKTPV